MHPFWGFLKASWWRCQTPGSRSGWIDWCKWRQHYHHTLTAWRGPGRQWWGKSLPPNRTSFSVTCHQTYVKKEVVESTKIPGKWWIALQGFQGSGKCRNRKLEPVWGAPSVAKVMRKEARHTQRRDRASGVPLEILEHLPTKPESAYFLLCALTYTSDFTEGCPPLPLSEKRVNLQLQLIIAGCDSVSTYKLLWKSSSLPE